MIFTRPAPARFEKKIRNVSNDSVVGSEVKDRVSEIKAHYTQDSPLAAEDDFRERSVEREASQADSCQERTGRLDLKIINLFYINIEIL